MFLKKQTTQNFATALWKDTALGTLAAAFFYSLFAIGVLDDPWLERYILGHPVSIATVFLFGISVAVLFRKCATCFRESRKLEKVNTKVLDLMQSMPSGIALESIRWLDSMLRAQGNEFVGSYLGARLAKVLRRTLQRGTVDQLDKDLVEIADDDAILQHESYSIVRIICWAMPMLGFLGTVVGISQTLGSMDMKLLASGDQAAMDSLTAGLYIAFDTTAIGLVLTIVAMFMQFVVSGLGSQGPPTNRFSGC